jgi:hypothetical protein
VPAEGVVTGWAEIAGRKVFVVVADGSLLGGAAGLVNIDKRFRVRRMAVEQGYPFIGLYEGSAIRFQDSMDAAIMSRVPAFREIVQSAGAIPQVAARMGACFGRPRGTRDGVRQAGAASGPENSLVPLSARTGGGSRLSPSRGSRAEGHPRSPCAGADRPFRWRYHAVPRPVTGRRWAASCLYRIGWLGLASPGPEVLRIVDAFRQGLRELGYVEGQNIVLEYRWAHGKAERLPDLATELIRLKVDFIMVPTTPAVSAARQATSTVSGLSGGSSSDPLGPGRPFGAAAGEGPAGPRARAGPPFHTADPRGLPAGAARARLAGCCPSVDS